MSEISDRYRNVAARFTRTAGAVPDARWDDQSPCEEWRARDVVGHMVDTTGYFLGRAGVDLPSAPSVDDDPVGAWAVARDAALGALDEPTVAATEFDSPMGRMTLERMIGMFGIADVLVHTWDLARATGQDETLDADEVQRAHEMMLPNDELLRQGTAFGPKVEVPDVADPQTRFLAFTGRHP